VRSGLHEVVCIWCDVGHSTQSRSFQAQSLVRDIPNHSTLSRIAVIPTIALSTTAISVRSLCWPSLQSCKAALTTRDYTTKEALAPQAPCILINQHTLFNLGGGVSP
jgi:hypothetical protein